MIQSKIITGVNSQACKKAAGIVEGGFKLLLGNLFNNLKL
jgi:hypothetical protein